MKSGCIQREASDARLPFLRVAKIENLERDAPMRADRVEVTWDQAKSNWLVRIATGEEVIRRHCKIPKGSDEQTLRSAVLKTVQDEGYDPDPTTLSIQR
jgi:hypothetical protein